MILNDTQYFYELKPPFTYKLLPKSRCVCSSPYTQMLCLQRSNKILLAHQSFFSLVLNYSPTFTEISQLVLLVG